MPQISYFLDIIIRMFYRDHNPPNFHGVYAEQEALVDIQKLELWSEHLPPWVLGLVIEWAPIHQKELMENWERARNMETLVAVAPWCENSVAIGTSASRRGREAHIPFKISSR